MTHNADNPKQHQNNRKISLCDIHKDNTSKIIKKMESKIPSFAQNYSDLYDAYLHMIDDIHSTFCMSEKEFIDKINISPESIDKIKDHSDRSREEILNGIDVMSSIFDAYIKMRISAIESLDRYAHVWLESYGNILSGFSKGIKSDSI